VSHDIKTPIASIYGAATSFLEEEHRLGQIDRRRLVESISQEAERLNRLVTNLLEMTQLDAGIQLKRDWHMLEDLVGTALARLEKSLESRPLSTEIPANLPLIWVDDVLIEGLFVNVLENAIKYTPAGTPLKIIAGRSEATLSISILDSGPGFEPGDEARIFEKFFRSRTDGTHGAGLGLAICRAIVRVHDGSIRAANRTEGGAAIYIELPIGGKPPDVESIPESALS
jgi:two-component system sensor histidine kinase KdpD